jgi:small GTP-binding protein
VGKGDHSPSSYSPLVTIGGDLPVIAEGEENPPARALPPIPPTPPVSSLSLYEKLHLGGGERGPTACESRDSEEEQRMKREGRGIDLTPLEGRLEDQLEREREEEEKGERAGERVGGGDSSLPIVRIFFVGDRGVGKSSLISSFLSAKGESSSKKKEGEKEDGGGESLPTKGVEFHTTLFSPQGEGGYRLQLWDAPGEHFAECSRKEGETERGESSSSLSSATSLFLEYYRSAHAFALVCSLSSYASVLSLPYWIDLIRGLHKEKEVPILLVGNKADLAEGR